MPLSLAFLLGGSDNLKGYSYNSLGPGKILTYNGFEIQKETVDHWYFVVFLTAAMFTCQYLKFGKMMQVLV